jgi:hypothetical protein
MELIRCRFCDAYLPDHARFCGYCGNAVGDGSAPTVNTLVPPGNPFRQEDGGNPQNYASYPANSAPVPQYPTYPPQNTLPAGYPAYPTPDMGMSPYPSSPLYGTVPPNYLADSTLAANHPSHPFNSFNTTPPPDIMTSGEQFSGPPMPSSPYSGEDDIANWPYPVSGNEANDYPTVQQRHKKEEDSGVFPIPFPASGQLPYPGTTPVVQGTPPVEYARRAGNAISSDNTRRAGDTTSSSLPTSSRRPSTKRLSWLYEEHKAKSNCRFEAEAA